MVFSIERENLKMNLASTIADLRQQRLNIDNALQALERLQSGATGRKRGRPPGSTNKANDNTGTVRTLRPKTAAEKKAQSLKMKAYWKTKRKAVKAKAVKKARKGETVAAV
jgi:hypothetical protein